VCSWGNCEAVRFRICSFKDLSPHIQVYPTLSPFPILRYQHAMSPEPHSWMSSSLVSVQFWTVLARCRSRFRPTDESSIVLSLSLKSKTPSKASKSPKTGSALVPFKQIRNAFAAVCASEPKSNQFRLHPWMLVSRLNCHRAKPKIRLRHLSPRLCLRLS